MTELIEILQWKILKARYSVALYAKIAALDLSNPEDETV
jgi:hypothetical protein